MTPNLTMSDKVSSKNICAIGAYILRGNFIRFRENQFLRECSDTFIGHLDICNVTYSYTLWHPFQVSKYFFYICFHLQTLQTRSRLVIVIVLQWSFQTYLRGGMFGLKCGITHKSLWHKPLCVFCSDFVRVLCAMPTFKKSSFSSHKFTVCFVTCLPLRQVSVLRCGSQDQNSSDTVYGQGHRWQKQKWLSHPFAAHRSQPQMASHWLQISFPTASLTHAEQVYPKAKESSQTNGSLN